MTAADKLTDLLEASEQRVQDLEAQIKESKEHYRWAWARHSDLPAEQTLPVPRLELYLAEDDGYNRIWIYRMIYRHLLGHCVAVPLGQTTQTGGAAGRSLLDRIPFRDGVHIQNEAKQFGWPMFAISEDEGVEIPAYKEQN